MERSHDDSSVPSRRSRHRPTGLRELLEDEDDLEVVGEAGTADKTLGRIPATQPNVALLDIHPPDGDGIEVCRDLRSRHDEVACLMLTSYADDEAVYASIMAGPAGYVLKQVKGTDLLDAVRRVAASESLLDPAVTARVLDRLRHRSTEELTGLTDQERRWRPQSLRRDSAKPGLSSRARS